MLNKLPPLFFYLLSALVRLKGALIALVYRKYKKEAFTLYQDLDHIESSLLTQLENNTTPYFLVDKTIFHRCYGIINSSYRDIFKQIKDQYHAYKVGYVYNIIGNVICIPFHISIGRIQPTAIRITQPIVIQNRLYHHQFAYVELQYWHKRDNSLTTFHYPMTNDTFNQFGFSDNMPDIDALQRVAQNMVDTHIERVQFPIDVVYTWVNRNDEKWHQQKNDFIENLTGSLHSASTSQSRFSDYNELKYSIQNLNIYAPFIRHIYIVTSSGTPDFLTDMDDNARSNISMVYHDDIFTSTENTPTFNSHAIETSLHRIKGLSEHFLYVNDDVFVNDFCRPEDFFFSNGMTKCFYSKKRIGVFKASEETEASTNSALNNRALLKRQFNKTLFKGFAKTPMALTVSGLKSLENSFSQKLLQTEAARFRHKHDISTTSSLIHYYLMAEGKAVPSSISNLTIGLDNRWYFLKFFYLLLAPVKHKTLCINEVNNKNDRDTIQQYLQLWFNDVDIPSSTSSRHHLD